VNKRHKNIVRMFEAAASRFLWFAAGAFCGYLWMARAFGLY